MCGGTGLGSISVIVGNGLSPRVRGNRDTVRLRWDRGGSIPACAGEPAGQHGLNRLGGVYPRVCGGTLVLLHGVLLVEGLSPRVRGNQVAEWADDEAVRSIPACAGEPRGRRRPAPSTTVYPRVWRGNRGFARRLPLGIGSIPACAGEPAWAAVTAVSGNGLSPRVRGNPYCVVPRRISGRSIPACAGEPKTSWRYTGTKRVYPRVCGGTGWKPRANEPSRGLSPRVRGNPTNAPGTVIVKGSIPACAGEPSRHWTT